MPLLLEDCCLCTLQMAAETPSVPNMMPPSTAFTPAVPGTLQRVPQLGEMFYSARGVSHDSCSSRHSMQTCQHLMMRVFWNAQTSGMQTLAAETHIQFLVSRPWTVQRVQSKRYHDSCSEPSLHASLSQCIHSVLMIVNCLLSQQPACLQGHPWGCTNVILVPGRVC